MPHATQAVFFSTQNFTFVSQLDKEIKNKNKYFYVFAVSLVSIKQTFLFLFKAIVSQHDLLLTSQTTLIGHKKNTWMLHIKKCFGDKKKNTSLQFI